MSRPTYVSGPRQFGGASDQARAATLADQMPLEQLEKMAVVATDAARRAEFEAAVRLGRGRRGGTRDSGGAVRDGSDDLPVAGRRVVLDRTRHEQDSGGAVRADLEAAPAASGRVVLDSSLRARLTEPIAAWDASKATFPDEPPPPQRRWSLSRLFK